MNNQLSLIKITSMVGITIMTLLPSCFVFSAEEYIRPGQINLKHNPFMIPDFLTEANTSDAGNTNPQELKVNGVLFNNNDSLIILNGKILGLYDEIDGYKLIHLSNQKAVFIKNEITTTLYLPNSEQFVKK